MVSLLVLSLVTARVQATPTQPDFSGSWSLDTPIVANPDTTRRLVVLQPITRTNVFGAPMMPAYLRITVRRESDSGNSEETRVISTVGGHMPGRSKEGASVGNSTRFETVWRGDALVFTDASYGPDGPRTGEWTERREEWSLLQDTRLRVEIQIESWKSTRHVDVYFYRRENAPRSPR
jgi:hypothetical protein